MTQPAPVPIDDGTELTVRSWRLLEAQGKDLGLPDLRIQPVAGFFENAEKTRTSRADRQVIVDQAILIFDHLYPHMPFKADLYHFTHPSDFLRTSVIPAIDSLGETEFHSRIISAFSLVRDAHTLYGLPSPYRNAVAFLPFQMRPYLDPKLGWRFVVTTVMKAEADGGFGHEFFGSGAEIVGWGDYSTLDHLQRTEEHLSGGNFFASFARSTIHATLRPLVFVQRPFQDELPAATIYYRPKGIDQTHAILIPWGIGTGFGPAAGFPGSAFSVSAATAITSSSSKYLHHRAEMLAGQQARQTLGADDVSSIPEVFDFQYTGGPRTKGFIDLADLVDPAHPEARFGYIKIQGFSDGSSVPRTDDIVKEFQRILTRMDQVAPDGLIIDIRSNPGGDVQAAERMLQMLVAREIRPTRFHLANTPAVLDILRSLKESMPGHPLSPEDDQKLSAALAELKEWLDDAEREPLPNGAPLTSGRPLTQPDSANDTGQIYQGRGVALLIDSLTYSAADIFAAGFQDHGIGVIVGTALVTGAGGANLWSHQDLIDKVGPRPGIPLEKLPADSSMSLAIRRCSRAGRFDGKLVVDDPDFEPGNVPLEDLGVRADVFYEAESIEDVIAGKPGILRRACKDLHKAGEFRVDAGNAAVLADGSVTVDVKTTNIESLKFFLDRNLTLTAEGGTRTVTVPAASGVHHPAVLRIEGYATAHGGAGTPQLVRSRMIQLRAPIVSATDAAGGISLSL